MDLTGVCGNLGIRSEVCRMRFWVSLEVGSSHSVPAAALGASDTFGAGLLGLTTQTKQ